jgi:hypothetical protein
LKALPRQAAPGLVVTSREGATMSMTNLKYRIIGYGLMVIGIGFILLAPLETYCFYLFSEGGRFHYEGFRFGSFMFGNIATQSIGYFFIGIVLTLIGYGHVRLHDWARKLTLSLTYSWLIVGLPITCIIIFLLLASKDLSVSLNAIIIGLLILAYLLFPFLLIRQYGSKKAMTAFMATEKPYMMNNLPIRLAVALIIHMFLIIVSLLLVFFNGIFPFFGAFKTGTSGIVLIDINCLFLAILMLGTIKRKFWAWWASIVYYSAASISLVITVLNTNYLSILSTLAFPDAEIKMLRSIPLRNYHILIFLFTPLLLALCNIILSKKRYSIDQPSTTIDSIPTGNP